MKRKTYSPETLIKIAIALCGLLFVLLVFAVGALMLAVNAEAAERPATIVNGGYDFDGSSSLQLHRTKIYGDTGAFIGAELGDKKSALIGLNYTVDDYILYAGYSYTKDRKTVSDTVYYEEYKGMLLKRHLYGHKTTITHGAVLGVMRYINDYALVGVSYNTASKTTMLTVGVEW